MILFTTAFTFGIWLLQQQAELPSTPAAWLLVSALSLILTRSVAPSIIRLALLAILSCSIGFFHAAWQSEQRLAVSLPDEWQGRNIDIIGTLSDLPKRTLRGQHFAFDVEKTLTPGVVVPQRIYLSTYSGEQTPLLRAGERWQLTVRLKQPHGSSNPHGFDFEFWALENNFRAMGYVHNKGHNIRLDAQELGIASWRESIRDKISSTLGQAPYAGVLIALAIGDQNSIPDNQWQLFRRTGTVHLMSISGLHVTLLAGLGFALTCALWRRCIFLTLPARKAAVIVTVLLAYGYSQLAGFGVPAQRTVYMVSAVAAALWLNRNFSLSQIMSFAVLGVLIPDPWAVLSPGFCLSFGAVAFILYTRAHRLEAKSESTAASTPQTISARIKSRLIDYALVQWSMSIGLIPLLLALFWQLSLISPIANAIAIPLIGLLVVPLTLAGALLPVEVPLWLAHIVLDITMAALQWLGDLPVWSQHAPQLWCILTGIAGTLWILAPRGFPARWLGFILLLPLFLNKPEAPEQGCMNMTIFDAGQGLSVALQTRSHTMLYDTGPERDMAPVLRAMGINALDELMLSHNDNDHAGGAAALLSEMPVNRLTSPPDLNAQAVYPNEPHRCHDGAHWIWDGVTFEILHPVADSLPSNNNSCVLRISAGNQHVLLTGDIGISGERRLLRQHQDQLSATVLIVPHHGSSGSSSPEFVAAVLPDYAVFTSGYRNRFGHPKEQILQRYQDSGATLLRSDKDGAIQIKLTSQPLTVERYRIEHRRYWTHQSR